MSKQKNSEKFTNYERYLIKKHINPKICVLSNGDDWEYLNDLINRFNADITILGSNCNLLYIKENQKPYDLIIYQSNKDPMSPQDNCEASDALGLLSEVFNKTMSTIRVSKYEDGYIRLDEIMAFTDGVLHLYPHRGVKNLREIIDIAFNNLIEFQDENRRKQEENGPTLVKKR